jgi:hypothetical protein
MSFERPAIVTRAPQLHIGLPNIEAAPAGGLIAAQAFAAREGNNHVTRFRPFGLGLGAPVAVRKRGKALDLPPN